MKKIVYLSNAMKITQALFEINQILNSFHFSNIQIEEWLFFAPHDNLDFQINVRTNYLQKTLQLSRRWLKIVTRIVSSLRH